LIRLGCVDLASTELESRARFLPWYRLVKGILNGLVEELNEIDVMEYVSEGVLTVPVVGVGEERRPTPVVEVALPGDEATLAIVYRDAESLRHLKNLLHASQTVELEGFSAAMRLLPAAFETRLLKKEFRGEGGFVMSRKYIACRVDGDVLQRLVEETGAMRSGGRRNIDGRSVYEAPATPVLQLVSVSVKQKEDDFKAALEAVKPILGLLAAVKTQREMIHSRVPKPVDKENTYRGFVDLLNRARSGDFISSEERRAMEKRWRESLDERKYLEEELRRKMGETI
jgi:hypothetical protein